MSIWLYSGTPGSYKSYHAVKDCISWLRSGKNVITNFALDFSGIKLKYSGVYEFWRNTDITCDNLLKFADEHHKRSYKPQTLVVIDEASVFFNPREFGRKDRMQWINFFANHRHFNFEIILVTQQDRMLDRQIRGLIEYEVKHRALAKANLLTFLLSKLFKGLYMTIDVWYPCKMRITSNLNRFRLKIANCYDTMALFVDTPKPVTLSPTPSKKSKSKVVISDVQPIDNDVSQPKTEQNTTTLDNNINYDVNTGVSVIVSDTTCNTS